jgi:hypothetical protein
MIEVPRGAMTADEIAKEAEFFSFGTNDLTQMGSGLSRDDAGKFLLYYQEHGLIEKDPFVTIDAAGVGLLVKTGVEKGRSVKKNLKIGVCGEHGGDPSSIRFFHATGPTTCPARPTGCRSPGWRRPRPSWSRKPATSLLRDPARSPGGIPKLFSLGPRSLASGATPGAAGLRAARLRRVPSLH